MVDPRLARDSEDRASGRRRNGCVLAVALHGWFRPGSRLSIFAAYPSPRVHLSISYPSGRLSYNAYLKHCQSLCIIDPGAKGVIPTLLGPTEHIADPYALPILVRSHACLRGLLSVLLYALSCPTSFLFHMSALHAKATASVAHMPNTKKAVPLRCKALKASTK